MSESKAVGGGNTSSSDDFDPSAYAAVANAARLVEIGLTDQTYSVKLPDLFTNIYQGGFDGSFKHSFGGDARGYSFNAENGNIVGGYEWRADVRKGREKVLKLKANYFLHYTDLVGADPKYVEIYFEKIARFASYPYFRALFATSVGNSGIFMPPLPSLTERVD